MKIDIDIYLNEDNQCIILDRLEQLNIECTFDNNGGAILEGSEKSLKEFLILSGYDEDIAEYKI